MSILLLFTIVAILEHPQETVFDGRPSSSLLQDLHLIRKFSIIFYIYLGIYRLHNLDSNQGQTV